MKKASLITIHRVFNYGTVLQAYASQEFIKNNGFDVELVDYYPKQCKLKYLFFSKSKYVSNNPILSIIFKIAKICSVIIKKIVFGNFIKKYLNLSKKYKNIEELLNNPPKADIYITGSDQVWNSKYNGGIDKAFFLTYAPPDAIKIGFAVSIGYDEINAEEKNELKYLASSYKAIGVREDTALKLLKSLDYKNDLFHMLDPTLLIQKNQWLIIASKRLIKENYLVLMLLYNEDNGATEFAIKKAKELNLKVVKLCWDYRKEKGVDYLMTHRKPQDFISLFNYADFVVTNSFHGLCFSIIFEKEFVVFERNEFNTRIESLLNLIGLMDRMVVNSPKTIFAQIDYAKINKILTIKKGEAADFISSYRQ